MKISFFLKKVFFFFVLFSINSTFAKQIKWDWNSINTNNIHFSKNFLWGCADSALQTEGTVSVDGQRIENSWTEFEKTLSSGVRVGDACERWTRFKEDLQLLADTGMNAYRFSIEWSKIEPKEGQFDYQAMQHYIDVVDECLRLGIVPFVALFHHACPIWFMKKGGFETSKNSHYFVRYATYVFRHLHEKVQMWIIFNEPIAYSMEAYFRGKYPPAKKSLPLTGKVCKNMLNAHVDVAKRFRAINSRAKIGITHMMHPIDGYSKWNPLEHSVGKWFSSLLNDTTIEFFRTGKFIWTPRWIRTYNEDAPKSIDFFGVNYYTHTTIKQVGFLKLAARVRPDEPIIDKSDDPERCKVMYPEGMYRSIKKAARLGIPIYITENGAATLDPAIKNDYLKKHLYVVSKAIQEGHDIRGYFFWTLMDCFSWHKGYNNKHGLYAVDFDTQERTYRGNAEYLIETIRRFRGL